MPKVIISVNFENDKIVWFFCSFAHLNIYTLFVVKPLRFVVVKKGGVESEK
jgi:hypothetical protein